MNIPIHAEMVDYNKSVKECDFVFFLLVYCAVQNQLFWE